MVVGSFVGLLQMYLALVAKRWVDASSQLATAKAQTVALHLSEGRGVRLPLTADTPVPVVWVDAGTIEGVFALNM